MDRKALIAAGEAIYGSSWKEAMANDLGVTRRTVSRWAAGDFAIADDVAGRLAVIARRKSKALLALAARLKAK